MYASGHERAVRSAHGRFYTRRLRRGVFRSGEELVTAIRQFLHENSRHPAPSSGRNRPKTSSKRSAAFANEHLTQDTRARAAASLDPNGARVAPLVHSMLWLQS